MTEKELKIVNGRINSLVNLFVQTKFEGKNGICLPNSVYGPGEATKYCKLHNTDCDLCRKNFIAKYRKNVFAMESFKMENFNTEEQDIIALFTTLVLFLLWKSNIIKCEFGWVFAPIWIMLHWIGWSVILSFFLYWCDDNFYWFNNTYDFLWVGILVSLVITVLMFSLYLLGSKESE